MKTILAAVQLLMLFQFVLSSALAQAPSTPVSEAINRYHVSPKAGEIFRHGNVPVNLSSGQIQYSIPVHTVQVGDFQWPVSLNYAYNGLLLEAKPSEVGLGWSLSGGGVVVRQVRGLPDEHQHGYWGISNRRNYIDAFVQAGDVPLNIVKDFVSNLYDPEPDKFTVSAGSLNVTFFISNTWDPGGCPFSAMVVTPTEENTKICFSWDQIEVTDASGVKYIFNVPETTDFSSSHWELMEMMQEYTTSWYLSEIRTPNGKSIYFGYDGSTIESISHSESYNRTVSGTGFTIDVDCPSLGGGATGYQAPGEYFRELSHSSTYNTAYIEAPYLSEITWDEGKVTIERNGGGSVIEAPRVSGIDIKNYDNQLIHSFDLVYDLQARAILSQVVKDNTEKYSFQNNPVFISHITAPYTGPPTNPNPAYAQDFWGFANGKSNKSSIPEKGGDRTPNYLTTLQGALTQIKYPTGGRTEITYEQNTVKAAPEDFLLQEPAAPNMQFAVSGTNTPLYQWHQESHSITFTKPTFAKISHGAFIKGTTTQLNMSFGPGTACTGTSCQTYYTYAPMQRLIYPGVTPSFIPTFGVGLTGDNIQTNCGTYFTGCDSWFIDEWILIPAGGYTLEISVFNTEAASFQVTIDYYDPDPQGTNAPFLELPAAGIRVASTRDCPDTPGSPCVEKHYEYIGDDGYGSGLYLSTIDYSYTYRVYDAHDCRDYSGGASLPLYFAWDYPAISFNFRTLNALEFNAGSPVYYNRVEVETTGSGKEVKYFHNSTYGFSGSYPYVPLPHNPINGAAWKTEYFKQDPGLTKIKDIVLQQSAVSPTPLDLNLFADGFLVGIFNEYRYVPIGFTAEDLLLNSYLYNKYEVEKPVKLLVHSQRETDYLYNLFTEVVNTYNGKLQPETTTTTNSDGKNFKSQFYYPHNLSDPGYTELVNINNISKQVKTEQYVNDVLQRSAQTFYQKWHNVPPIVQPLSVVSTQSGSTVVEATINSYSPSGNLLEGTPRNGVKSSLIWGYNDLFPLVEVKNAASTTVAFTSFEGPNNEGGWTFTKNTNPSFKTGSNSHLLTANPVSRTTLDAATNYKLTYWAKGGVPALSGGVTSSNDAAVPDADGWQYFEKTITGVISLTLSFLPGTDVWLDELRLYPSGAIVTSYTYKPLVGITSVTDPNNRITYYEYDTVNRLKVIRDHKGNILKSFTYNYRK